MQSEELDPDLCAKLYNRVIRIVFHGSGRDQGGERLIQNWFEVWSGDPLLPQCRQTFSAPLISVLEQVEVVVDENGRPGDGDVLVPHLQSLSSPQTMLALGMDMDESIILFHNNLYSLDESLGVVMDPNSQTVCYFPYLLEYDRDHPENSPWRTLHQLLARLNAIIDVGIYRAVPLGQIAHHDPGQALIPGWDVLPWNDFTLNQGLQAYEALVDAITSRLPSSSQPLTAEQRQPIATEKGSSLDPQIQGFPRAFVLAASKPCFQYIAPGLTVYNTTRPPPLPRHHPNNNYHYISPNTNMSYIRAYHNPLILFPAAEEGHQRLEAGLWICPDEGWADTVRLVLPHTQSSYPVVADGTRSARPRSTELWQQGNCPFYVGHSTRLPTLLDRWRELIEEGVWTVGEHGVEGGMEFYRQAEDPDKADWFQIWDDCFDLSGVEFDWDVTE